MDFLFSGVRYDRSPKMFLTPTSLIFLMSVPPSGYNFSIFVFSAKYDDTRLGRYLNENSVYPGLSVLFFSGFIVEQVKQAGQPFGTVHLSAIKDHSDSNHQAAQIDER